MRERGEKGKEREVREGERKEQERERHATACAQPRGCSPSWVACAQDSHPSRPPPYSTSCWLSDSWTTLTTAYAMTWDQAEALVTQSLSILLLRPPTDIERST